MKLSELILSEPDECESVLGKPVMLPNGRRLGIVERVILYDSDAIKYVIVRQDDGVLRRFKASELVLNGDSIILVEPLADKVLSAIVEVNKASLELTELYVKLIKNYPVNVGTYAKIVSSRLGNALKIMEEMSGYE